MEAPYTIASLPKPLDAENGAIYAAPVFSYRGLKKIERSRYTANELVNLTSAFHLQPIWAIIMKVGYV